MDAAARILVVDDHPLICRAVSALLEPEADLEFCGSAADVTAALELVQELAPDLAVVDISLKSGSGIELTKRIRAQHASVKVLVLSMHDETLFAERALHAGALGYVHKQQASEQLVVAIRRVLDGHVHLSVEMTDNLLQRAARTGSDEAGAVVSVEQLTDRELEVFELTGQGMTTREIGERLHISMKTVESHRDHIRGKLNIRTGAELARHAVQWVLENH